MSISNVLIANRGEIAVRIAATLRGMGITATAVYTAADSGSAHVQAADIALDLGPDPRAYLDADLLVRTAVAAGADAIHPGYGFLAENAAFARMCQEAGLTFIGPPPAAIEVMGDKISAKRAAEAAGVPVVPGRYRPGMTDADIEAAVVEIGLPVMLKPSAGGGGKGMRVVTESSQLSAAITSARREAAASFGDDTLMVERFLQAPRHIEVQVLGDRYGGVRHVLDRECSLQRRHQKVVEEAPALLPESVRESMFAHAEAIAAAVGYVGAGTVEFIVDGADPSRYYFLEMNTRLQVEHPVTEMVTGLDLVARQVRLAEGERLAGVTPQATGHAVEVRLYAEDPGAGFLPTGGDLLALDLPAEAVVTGPHPPAVATGGSGEGAPARGTIRVDPGVLAGSRVTSDYDPMIAKIIAHGADRDQARRLLLRALEQTAVLGLRTNQRFLVALLAHPDVAANTIDTGWIERHPELVGADDVPDHVIVAAATERLLSLQPRTSVVDPWQQPTGWRMGEPAWAGWRFALPDGSRRDIFLRGVPEDLEVRIAAGLSVLDGTGETFRCSGSLAGDWLTVTQAGRTRRYRIAGQGRRMWLAHGGSTWAIEEVPRLQAETRAAGGGGLVPVRSPMPGTVIAVHVAHGDAVSEGDPVIVVEAMKMEHTLHAPAAGQVAEILAVVGDQVALDADLVTFAEIGAGQPATGLD